MDSNQKDSIRKKVATLLRRHGVTSAPVPVERIAGLKAQIRYSRLDDKLSGMVYVKDGTAIIGVNALHHPNRQRFTIAHELGHLILHKPMITKEIHVDKKFPMLMRAPTSSAKMNQTEVEANYFAAEILMPVSFLIRSLKEEPFIINDIDIDDDIVASTLAKKYEVSVSAMRFRLSNLFA